jgi:MFS family permease
MTGTPESGVLVLRVMMGIAAAAYILSVVPIFLARPRGASSDEPAGVKAAQAGAARGKLFGSNPRLLFTLLLPGALVGLGAGMTIPFMNIYIERKFNVDFAQLGQLFAWTAVATAVALLLQPMLAERVGKVKSVVIVQIASLPFLLVLGYVEFFPLVAVALFVRAALMNMGNPVFSAYAMERVEERDRATYASLASSTWSLGWASGSWLSGALRDALGFFEGFAILFGLMAALYATSTVLLWVLFGGEESRRLAREAAERENAVEDAPALAA